MKVDIRTLLQENGATADVQIKGSMKDFKSLNVELEGLDHFSLQGYLMNLSERVKFKGNLQYSYEKSCDRCLEMTKKSVDVQLEEFFYRESPTLPDDAEYSYQAKTLDLSKFIIDQILVSLPTKNICVENCEGICSQCGKNLNLENCNCTTNLTDPRFHKLNDLLTLYKNEEKNELDK